MKNQFFADRHDYFKYDLWLEVGEKVGGIKRLTFIPMLTPDGPSNEGRKTTYPEGKRRKRLYGFLQFCLVPKRRSITRLREFLCDEPFEYHPYRDEDDKGFQDGSWDAYFSAIPCEWLRDAIVLIDPDTGLETNTASKKRHPEHVTYKNIASVANRCSGNSVILIVQFLSQGNAHVRERQLQEKLEKLHKELPPDLTNLGSILWIAEKARTGLPGELALFAIGASGQRRGRLEALLRRYKKAHDLLHGPS